MYLYLFIYITYIYKFTNKSIYICIQKIISCVNHNMYFVTPLSDVSIADFEQINTS